MPYVDRDDKGRVVGIFAARQYHGQEFTEEDVQLWRPPPHEVTMRQARLALLAIGKLAAVDAAIDGLPEPDRTAARISWEYSGTVQRHQPFVLALAPALGLDAAGLDALFMDAATR